MNPRFHSDGVAEILGGGLKLANFDLQPAFRDGNRAVTSCIMQRSIPERPATTLEPEPKGKPKSEAGIRL